MTDAAPKISCPAMDPEKVEKRAILFFLKNKSKAPGCLAV